ncbi:ABC transporter permease [Dictyobacter alpinus]|uniref:ABC transporter permease n=1 Tax=Dictyobacter alpinus TaxID=2014873 RepID=A0A402BHY0_9CHLR|nr:ABC transporter permease [Dictyobacter alpinus]GCE30949.1 ABC transporter permease [Dictyobacter alpinus]
MSNKTEVKPTTEVAPANHNAEAIRASGDTRSNTIRNIGLILRREYKNRVTQRSYIITTILFVVFALIGSCVPTAIQFFAARSNSQSHVTIVNNAGTVAGFNDDALMKYFSQSLNGTNNQNAGSSQSSNQSSTKPHFILNTDSTDSVQQLQKNITDGKLEVLLVLERVAGKDVHFTYYTAAASLSDTDLTQIQTATSQLSVLDKSSHLGLSSAQTQNLLTPPDFKVVYTQPGKGNASALSLEGGYFLGVIGTVLIFMSVYLYGMWVAGGVADEKGNRIMEILVNAATPFQLLWGKIIGIGAAGLTQMVCLIGAAFAGLLLQKPLSALLKTEGTGFDFSYVNTSATMLLLLLVYFILGFLLYSTLFAALGALVKRQDEVQNAVGPLTTICMVGYMASFIGGSLGADATWFKVMSFVPFWTPMMMLMRAATGTVSSLDIIVSIVILIVSILICSWISSRIYRMGILMYGQKPNLGQLIKILRQ